MGLLQNSTAAYFGLALRERALLLLTTVAAIGACWMLLFGDGQSAAIATIERASAGLRSSIDTLQQRADLLSIGSKRDPNAALNRKLLDLDAELAAGRTELADLLDRFVTPERMPGLLQEFLSSHPNLKLHKVSNLRVHEVEGAGVYRHSMIIELSGGYFAVLRYLQALEESDWAFNWRSLDYVVEVYPRARVRLEIETLSDERSWIGV